MSFVPAIFLTTPVRYNLPDFYTVINTYTKKKTKDPSLHPNTKEAKAVWARG